MRERNIQIMNFRKNIAFLLVMSLFAVYASYGAYAAESTTAAVSATATPTAKATATPNPSATSTPTADPSATINPFASPSPTDSTSEAYRAWQKIAGYVSNLYIDDSFTSQDVMLKGISELLKTDPELLVPLLKATLKSMDEYCEFFTADEYKQYENSINQTFYGIGVSIGENGDYVEITGFSSDDSAAISEGFQVGDKIKTVDGTDCTGKSIVDVRNLIVGKLGTTVEITVLRGESEVTITATRIEIKRSTVTGGTFIGDVGYVKISTFGDTTSGEFSQFVADFKEKGVKKVIIDLRNDPGGLLQAAVDIAQQIVPAGKIIDVVYRDTTKNTTYTSELKEAPFDIQVLVNGNTASSAEILSSAIQDSGVGKLVGTNTYGKAVVQGTYPLTNGMLFKLTVGQYKTRNGKEINHIGLEPDNYVKNTSKKIDATKYPVFSFNSRYALGVQDTSVLSAKEKLAMLNYYAGTTDDSIFNTDLRQSVTKFQRDNNLCSSGVLDVATQVKIEEKFEELEITINRQLQAAYEAFGGNPDDLYKTSEATK